jgi:hypothetical protein
MLKCGGRTQDGSAFLFRFNHLGIDRKNQFKK